MRSLVSSACSLIVLGCDRVHCDLSSVRALSQVSNLDTAGCFSRLEIAHYDNNYREIKSEEDYDYRGFWAIHRGAKLDVTNLLLECVLQRTSFICLSSK